MEDLLLNHSESQILQAHKRKLESRYKVRLNMPEVKSNDSCGSEEVIFVNIVGDKQSIYNVKKFLKRKVDAMRGRVEQENNTTIVILDSDSEGESILSENNANKPRRKKARTEARKTASLSTPNQCNSTTEVTSADNSVIEVSSTSDYFDNSVIIIEPTPPAEDFIPLGCSSKSKLSHAVDDDIIELSSDEDECVSSTQSIPRPIERRLRPIAIDGNNVARAHGKPTNTFSCKGIKLSVEYFLKRGHSQVTAFLPLFRKHCKRGPILTTDQDILEELEKKQNVVFTPSRFLNGKTYASYDDRFIVEFAASTGGVVLSNDNFKDIINEREDFKETIEKRLLMFCFVGDLLMIPQDPLGSKGPNIKEFLSFPPETDKD